MAKRRDKKFKPVLTKATIDYLEQFEMGEAAENFKAIQKTKKKKGAGKISEFREVIPTLEGLGLYIGRSVALINSYCKENVKFREAVERIKLTQAMKLITYGLSNKFNQGIVKIILVKHGYINKEEIIDDRIKPEIAKKLKKEIDKILKINNIKKEQKEDKE